MHWARIINNNRWNDWRWKWLCVGLVIITRNRRTSIGLDSISDRIVNSLFNSIAWPFHDTVHLLWILRVMYPVEVVGGCGSPIDPAVERWCIYSSLWWSFIRWKWPKRTMGHRWFRTVLAMIWIVHGYSISGEWLMTGTENNAKVVVLISLGKPLIFAPSRRIWTSGRGGWLITMQTRPEWGRDEALWEWMIISTNLGFLQSHCMDWTHFFMTGSPCTVGPQRNGKYSEEETSCNNTMD